MLDRKQLYYKVIGNNFGSMTYTVGMNVDKNRLTRGICMAGGIYFTDMKNLPLYLGGYGHLIATIKIPDDAEINTFPYKCKADKVEITKIETVRSFCKNNPKFMKMCIEKIGDELLELFLTTNEDKIIQILQENNFDVLYSPKLSKRICEDYSKRNNLLYPKEREMEYILKRIYKK